MPGSGCQRLPVQADRSGQTGVDDARVVARLNEGNALELPELDNIEVDLFVQALQRRHGYDFSEYAPASLKRRVQQLAEQLECKTISRLTERTLHEPELLQRVLDGLTVPASDMFRDPA